MNAAPDPLTNDPLGYERFALTESAYDLVTSLIGVYARACYRNLQSPEVPFWEKRLDELHAMRHTADWSNLSSLQLIIDQLSAEYKQVAQIETGQLTYDTTQSGALHSA